MERDKREPKLTKRYKEMNENRPKIESDKGK